MGHALLAEMPAKEHQITAFGVARRKVDEPAVEILHLDAGFFELRDEQADLARDALDGCLGLLDPLRVEPTPVAGHLPADLGQPPAFGHEAPPRIHEPFHQWADHGESVIRFLLGEEAHAC